MILFETFLILRNPQCMPIQMHIYEYIIGFLQIFRRTQYMIINKFLTYQIHVYIYIYIPKRSNEIYMGFTFPDHQLHPDDP